MRDVARFFKVLADEARLKLLWLLLNHRELCVCDLMAALEITQSKASRHLATLRHAGLVTDRKEGTWSHYSIRPVDGKLERALLEALRAQLADHPGAAQVLRTLHEGMAGSGRDALCVKNGTCRTATASGRRGPRRAPLAESRRAPRRAAPSCNHEQGERP